MKFTAGGTGTRQEGQEGQEPFLLEGAPLVSYSFSFETHL